MRPQVVVITCLAFIICIPLKATAIQPVEQGLVPLRDRLAVIRNEATALRAKLISIEGADPDREAIVMRLAALKAEEKELAAEIISSQILSRSPYITYFMPRS